MIVSGNVRYSKCTRQWICLKRKSTQNLTFASACSNWSMPFIRSERGRLMMKYGSLCKRRQRKRKTWMKLKHSMYHTYRAFHRASKSVHQWFCQETVQRKTISRSRNTAEKTKLTIEKSWLKRSVVVPIATIWWILWKCLPLRNQHHLRSTGTILNQMSVYANKASREYNKMLEEYKAQIWQISITVNPRSKVSSICKLQPML